MHNPEQCPIPYCAECAVVVETGYFGAAAPRNTAAAVPQIRPQPNRKRRPSGSSVASQRRASGPSAQRQASRRTQFKTGTRQLTTRVGGGTSGRVGGGTSGRVGGGTSSAQPEAAYVRSGSNTSGRVGGGTSAQPEAAYVRSKGTSGRVEGGASAQQTGSKLPRAFRPQASFRKPGSKPVSKKPLRFSRVRKNVAEKMGITVNKAQSGYSYPEMPAQAEQEIPNYYADSRKRRLMDPIPEDGGHMARSIGRYVFESMPDDPDRGDTVEATIANILDYAAHEATQAQDQTNAEYLAKISAKWRKVIGKSKAAIDPDAPAEPAETGYLAGFFPGALLENRKTPAILTLGLLSALGVYASRGKTERAEVKRILGFALPGIAVTALVYKYTIRQK